MKSSHPDQLKKLVEFQQHTVASAKR
jgi:hypothetical protein